MEGNPEQHAAPDDNIGTRTDARRLCGYSGCRAPLPASSGPGNRPRYCQDGKTWGERNVSCKQAGHAEELLASIGTTARTSPPAETELAERIRALLAPTRELVSALERVREQLEAEVVEVRQERDQANQFAAEQRGLREIADGRAAEAERNAAEYARTAEQANKDRNAAVTRATAAAEAEERAHHARLRAEARSEELVEQVRRSDERLEIATGRVEDTDRRLAAASVEIEELRARLSEERQRSEAERTRADQLVAQHHHQLEELRDAAETRAEDLRRDHERERAVLSERHQAEVADLHERLGGERQRLIDEQQTSDRRRRELDEWRAELTKLVERTTQQPDQFTRARPTEAGVNDRVSDKGADPSVEIELVESDLITRLQALLNQQNR